MYKRMLVPLDGSELAEAVFPYARELAEKLNLEIILLHVSRPALDAFLHMRRAYIEHAVEAIKHDLKKPAKAGKPIGVLGEIAEGYPAEEILRYADEKAADFILIATHGRSGLKRWTLGSVVDKVLRASKIPVFLVPTGVQGKTYDQWPKKTLIVPLDGSELAGSVLKHVEALTEHPVSPFDEVVLVRVCEPPVIPSYYAPEVSEVPFNWGELIHQETVRCRKEAEDYLAKIEKQLKERKINVRSEVLAGKAADEVVDYVKKNPFSVIVMATHGRSGLKRLVYGSVAANILHGVSNPIFLVKPA